MKTTRTRARRSEKVWQRHIQGWQSSGLSQREYCERAGVALSTFTLWRGRLQGRTVAATVPLSTTVEIVPIAKLPKIQERFLTLVYTLGNGRVKWTLRTVVHTLEDIR
jgi:hypothetical protein